MANKAAIRPLAAADAAALARLLQSQPAGYLAHFHPFPFDRDTLEGLLSGAVNDRYWALEAEDTLAGFFMLRGFDAGYARPSFGVFVAERWNGRGLAARALEFCKAWCAERGVACLMLKVAPGNAAAKAVYESAGFLPAGTCPDTGHAIYEWRSAQR